MSLVSPKAKLIERFGKGESDFFYIAGAKFEVTLASPGYFSVKSIEGFSEEANSDVGILSIPYVESFTLYDRWEQDDEAAVHGFWVGPRFREITQVILEAVNS